MELVATGYKMTEVGLVPDDWHVSSLGESFEVHNNLRLPLSEDVRKKIQGIYPYYGPTKIQDYINEYRVEGEYSLIGEDGDHFLKWNEYPMTQITKGKFNVNNHAHLIKGKTKKTLTKWFYWFFKHRDITQHLTRQGAGRYKLSKASLIEIPCAIPPTIEEQTAIATALSDADALITSLEKLITKKQNIKQGAMQKLLQPKEYWEHKSLGEIGIVTGAGVDKTINEGEVPVRLVNYMDVFKRDFIYSGELSHWVTTPSLKAQKCAVQKGDIFFTPSSEMRFDIAISAVAMEDIQDAAYSYHLVRLRLLEDWDLHFRVNVFKTQYFFDQAETLCEGSGKRYVISLPKFRSMKIYYPPLKSEQSEISTILNDMDYEISILKKRLSKAKNIKQAMMQQLLTGKIRLV